MEMAKSVANLITASLRHANGMPVECVIGDTIGGISEAAACAEKFARNGVGVSLTVTRAWCYGTETMDMDPFVPKAVWGFNGTERPGAVYLAAVLAGHSQKGLPAFGIYGREVQEADDTTIPDDVKGKILDFVQAGVAVARMRGNSYLSMGSVSMGIAGSIGQENLFQNYLGMRNEYVDMSEFIRRIEENIYDPDEYERALTWVQKYCKEGDDANPSNQRSKQQKQLDWETVVKMTIIGRDLMIGNPRLAEIGFGEEALGHNAIAAGFQGQRHWTDFRPNGDFLETMLNSSFDWNGIRQPFVVATENDSLNGIAMLFGNLLTGSAQIFADVRTYWSSAAVERLTGVALEGRAADGIIHLINSGSAALDGTGEQQQDGKPAIKPFWDVTAEEAIGCLEATEFRAAMVEYFRGGGFSTDYLTKGGMPVTMSRINMIDGLGPALQIAEGHSVDLPPALHAALDERTNPTWPTTWFVPRLGSGAFTDVYSVMANWGANHGVVSFGHIGAKLITLASMLRIPVCMHNVATENIFRPSTWNAFGMDPEGADYRACAALGPLYGK